MTTSLIWFAFVSFALSLILTPIFRDIFRSYGVVDQPDHGRKIHKYPIPRVGGMAIASSYVACFFLVPLFNHIPYESQLSLVWGLLPAAGVIFAVGVIDDLFGLKPWQKLLGQIAGSGIAYWSGVRVLDVVGFSTHNWWSLPVTVLWLLTCTNAFNLVDGMDGLAAGVGLFATLDHVHRRADARQYAACSRDNSARGLPAWFSLLQLQSCDDFSG